MATEKETKSVARRPETLDTVEKIGIALLTLGGSMLIVRFGLALLACPVAAANQFGIAANLCIEISQTVFNYFIANLLKYGHLPLEGGTTILGFKFIKSKWKQSRDRRASQLDLLVKKQK